jgi:hypothetical protein
MSIVKRNDSKELTRRWSRGRFCFLGYIRSLYLLERSAFRDRISVRIFFDRRNLGAVLLPDEEFATSRKILIAVFPSTNLKMGIKWAQSDNPRFWCKPFSGNKTVRNPNKNTSSSAGRIDGGIGLGRRMSSSGRIGCVRARNLLVSRFITRRRGCSRLRLHSTAMGSA